MKMLFLLAVIGVGGGFFFHEDILNTFEDASYRASSGGGGGGGGPVGAMSEYDQSLKGGFNGTDVGAPGCPHHSLTRVGSQGLLRSQVCAGAINRRCGLSEYIRVPPSGQVKAVTVIGVFNIVKKCRTRSGAAQIQAWFQTRRCTPQFGFRADDTLLSCSDVVVLRLRHC